MKKLIKIIIYFIITIVVVLALAIGGVIMFVNPNQFKPQITELVEKNANVILQMNGDIEWTFYPWLGIKVQHITIASPNSPTVPIAEIKSAQASILLKSLFNQELNISDVVIDGLSVSLLKDAKGNSNWVFAKENNEAVTPKIVTHETSNNAETAKKSDKKIPELYVKGVSINNANIVYKDAQSNQALSLKNFNAKTGEVMLNHPISVSIESAYSLFNPKFEGDIALSAVVDFNTGTKKLLLNDLQVKNNLAMNDVELHMQLSGIVEMETVAQLLQISNLSMKNNGKIKDIVLNDVQVKSLVKVDLQKEIVNLDQLQMIWGDLNVTGQLSAENYSTERLKYVGKLATNTFNLKAFLDNLKIELPQFNSKTALQKAAVQFDFNGNLKNIDINPLQINFDETKVSGSSAVALGDVPTIALALKGDHLIINNYLAPEKATDATAGNVPANQRNGQSHPVAQAPKNPEVIPVLPKNLNVVADIQMDQLTLDRLQIAQSRVKGSLKNGDAVLDQLSMNIYGGNLFFNGSLKDSKKPHLALDGKIKKIDLGKIIPQVDLKNYISSDFLLSRLNKTHQNLSVEGILDSNFSMTTAGRLQNEVIANLNGKASFDVLNGRVDNLNYEKLMCQGIALLNQKTLTDTFNRNYTDFQKLSGQFMIRNGVVTNNPFQMLIPGLNINGKGEVNLNRLTINYGLNAVLTGDHSINPDPACQINQRFKGIAIPLICEGSLEKTEGLCRLNTDQLGKVAVDIAVDAAKEKAVKELDQHKDKLQEKLDNEIDKQLKKNPAIKGLLQNIL